MFVNKEHHVSGTMPAIIRLVMGVTGVGGVHKCLIYHHPLTLQYDGTARNEMSLRTKQARYIVQCPPSVAFFHNHSQWTATSGYMATQPQRYSARIVCWTDKNEAFPNPTVRMAKGSIGMHIEFISIKILSYHVHAALIHKWCMILKKIGKTISTQCWLWKSRCYS